MNDSAPKNASSVDSGSNFAPPVSANGAQVMEAESAETATSNPSSAAPGVSTGPTPERQAVNGKNFARKPRIMTALLDKIKGGVRNQAPPMAADTPDDTGLTNDSGAARNSALLADTAPSTHAPKPMNFTYAPGSTPLDRYTIRRGIGMGGFGEVYFAISEAGKEVALKRVQRNLEVELRGVSHCLNLKHPNLVALYDICRDSQDQAWVVMEYVAGKNLRQILDDSPAGLPDHEVKRWFGSIASGVHHLHTAGLVHRDIKPGNIFDDLGVVKVGDYGLSKFISASHRGGHTESVGTFHYMAPEIGRGQYGREIDVYAMGILLYELLTGRVPFDGESCHEIIVKHLTATPDLEGIAQPYRAVIEQALRKDPAHRQHSLIEMAESVGVVLPPTPGMIPNLAAPIEAELVSEVDAPIEAVPVSDSPFQPGNPLAQVSTPTHDQSSSLDASDEPLARAIKHSLADLSKWWHSLDQSPGSKALIAVVIGFVLVANTGWLLPLLSFVAVFYVPYYIIRHMVLHVRQQPSYAQAQRIATAHGVKAIPLTKDQWRNQIRTGLRAKRSVHRMAELGTSWVASSFTVITLMVIAGVIGLRTGNVDATALAPYGWMAAVILIASLGMLGVGKLWEHDEGEGLPRRLCLAGMGAGVGVAAFWLHEFLLLPSAVGLARDIDSTPLPQALYTDGIPGAAGVMAHFALLFAAVRWWKPVDPLRRKRLSLWAVAVATVGEWCVHQILPIPQPAGYLIAGGIAIAVQMSAPWINPRLPPVSPGSTLTPTADQRRTA